MTESERIKQKLLKLGAVVLKTDKGFDGNDRIYVLYNQDNKTKLAYFNLTGYYYDRYGPNVIATFSGHRFWFKSAALADSLTDNDIDEMERVFKGDSILPDFDPSVLGEFLS